MNPHQTIEHTHPPTGKDRLDLLGYSQDMLEGLPDSLIDAFKGIGNPFEIAPLKAGATIVDLGSGVGVDSCIAGFKTGGRGKVYGIDSESAMLDQARAASKALWLRNVIFIQGDMENIPLPSNLADIVMSNGVGCMCLDKEVVFGEMYRILRDEGQLQLADMIAYGDVASSPTASDYPHCINEGTYRALLEEAGFTDVKITAVANSVEGPEAGLRACHVYGVKRL